MRRIVVTEFQTIDGVTEAPEKWTAAGMASWGSAKPGMIEASTDGPYVVTGVPTLVNSRGERLPAQPK